MKLDKPDDVIEISNTGCCCPPGENRGGQHTNMIAVCRLGYVEAALDAERRLKRGERQRYCSECGGLWRWDDECTHEGKMTEREFNSCAHVIRKGVRRAYPSQEDKYRKVVRKTRPKSQT